MQHSIPCSNWSPLTVTEVHDLFRDAPFTWGLAGGHAIERFVGRPIREHGDVDVILFRDDQRAAHEWLAGWHLHAADPPGTLRSWTAEETLPPGVHDIWCHRRDAQAWQLQLMLAENEGEEWFSRRNAAIRGSRREMIVEYGGLPCIRVEVQLLFKAKTNRAKDLMDLHACLPLLSGEARAWLRAMLQVAHPEGHAWSGMIP
ncbi:MAG TPA: amino acid transporter [Candidatus Kapabacteria bacterium]|nr:amino acid transporter [Candidatus Kapabacteria bacterium]